VSVVLNNQVLSPEVTAGWRLATADLSAIADWGLMIHWGLSIELQIADWSIVDRADPIQSSIRSSIPTGSSIRLHQSPPNPQSPVLSPP
jgi:hypothetical protein